MNIDERYKHLRMMQPRYRKAGRKEKGRLLSETEERTGLHRKYVIQLMNGPPPHRKKRRRQRGRKYGAQVDDAIRVIGKALDWVCAERLKPALPKMARHLTKFGELRVTPALLEQLEQISISTVRRIVKRVRQDEYRLPQRRGLEHEYWRRQVTRLYEGQGYRVSVEEPINGYADLVAEKGDQRIGIEIETGKSNWRDNITRDLARGFSQVVVVCTNERVHRAISREAMSRWADQEGRLSIVQAQEFCA